MNHAVNDSSSFLLSSLFPIVLAEFGISVLQVAILISVGNLVSVVGQPLVGRYSEGADPRKLLAVGIATVSVSVFTFVLSTGFYSLLASLVLLRVGSSFFHPVGVSAVSRAYSGPDLDRAMGIQSAFGNLGIFLVFVSAAPVYLAFGWKSTFMLFALVGALDVAITLILLRVPKIVTSRAPGVAATPNADRKYEKRKKSGLLGTPMFFLGTTFVSGGCFTLVLNYTNILLESGNGVSVSAANTIVAGWVGFAFLGAISTGRWPNVMRRISLLALIFLLSAVSIFLFGLVSGSLGLAIPLLLFNGFILSATYPLTYSELSDFLADRPETRGRAFGAIFSAQTIGGAAFAFVTGLLSEHFGLASAYLMAGVAMLVGAAMVVNWARRTESGSSAGKARVWATARE
jgi:FSR family fosmidomycin resistance protein-like MFS transporter